MAAHIISIIERVSNDVHMVDHVFLSKVLHVKMLFEILPTHILASHYLNHIFLLFEEISIPVEKPSKDLRRLMVATHFQLLFPRLF
jgi:hypothetical protein